MLTACGQEAPIPVAPAEEEASASVQLQTTLAETSDLATTPDATEMPIQRVDSLMISRLNDREATVLIMAAGSVGSDGWTGAHLEPVAQEEDGPTRSFRFLATSPETTATNLIPQTVEARLEIPGLPPEVEMIRVIAEKNELTAFVSE
jgi:hypothetical protein